MFLSLCSALLYFLQIPVLPLSLGTKLVGLSKQRHHGYGAKDLNNLGNISPYHDGPKVPGVSVKLPNDCVVDQVVLMQRHGSRGPTEPQPDGYIHQLVDILEKASDLIQTIDLPDSLEFLKGGYKYQLDPGQLSAIGRKELFSLGVEFSLRYPTFSTDVVITTAVQRVIDSAHFFMQGLVGLQVENVTFKIVDDFHDPVSWLDPWHSCPNMSQPRPQVDQWVDEYIPSIVKRLNKLAPGVDFTLNAVRGALQACAFDLAARRQSPWCDVFTTHELRNFEYELDLDMDSYTGHASRGDPGPMIGSYYVKKLIERLTNETAEALYLDFGHETTILMAMSTMGLNKDAVPLGPTNPPAHRKFRTSDQTPFAANMIWEKFTCSTSFQGPQVRLVLNNATFPLIMCEKSEKDKKYGTCSLSAFVAANEYSLGVEYHNSAWNATCEARK